jgi:membrane peptidoglycan carboxypeptidase
MWRSFGGDLPARIWKNVMVYANRNTKESKLPITSPSKVGLLVCADTKQRIGPKCPKSSREMVPRYAIPRQFCTVHGAPVYMPGAAVTDGKDKPSKDSSPTDTAAEAAAETTDPGLDTGAAPVPTQVEIPIEIPLEPPVGGQDGPPEPVTNNPPPVQPQPVEIPPPPPAPVELPPPPPPEPVVVPIAPPTDQ